MPPCQAGAIRRRAGGGGGAAASGRIRGASRSGGGTASVRLRAQAPGGFGAAPGGARAPRHRARPGQLRRTRTAPLRRAGARALTVVRRARGRFLPSEVRELRRRAAGGLLVQRPRVLSELLRAANERHRGAPGRPRAASCAVPAVGALPPPLAKDRLSIAPGGRVVIELKRPMYDGTTEVAYPPVALVRRLAAIVPPPRAHLTRYFGVFAPASQVRVSAPAMGEESSEPQRAEPTENRKRKCVRAGSTGRPCSSGCSRSTCSTATSAAGVARWWRSSRRASGRGRSSSGWPSTPPRRL